MADLENTNFIKKTYEEIFLNQLQDAYEQGLLSSDSKFMDYINNREDIENNYVMQSSVHSKTLETAYEDMQLIYDALDLDNATNQDLEYLGELVGIIRYSAQSSSTELIFFIMNDAETDITIPAGTIVSTEDQAKGTNYYTISDCIINAGTKTSTVTAFSEQKGNTSHVNKKELTHISSNLNETSQKVYVYNTIASTGGRVRETDDEYRIRIRKWPYLLKRGTIDTYINYLDNVEGLNGYNIIQRWDGPGTIKIVIDPGTDYLLSTILSGLEDEVAVADDDILLIGATERSIDVNIVANISLDNNIEYTTEEKTAIETSIKNLITTYIDGGYILAYEQLSNYQTYGNIETKVYEDAYHLTNIYYAGLTIGENFVPQKCATFIDEQLRLSGNNPVMNIEFNIPSSFTADSTTDYYGDIDDEETATTGNITIQIT